MLFPTLDFAIFFLVAFVLIWAASPSNEWRKILLLLGSWVFYGAWDWRFVALLIASAVINWGAARLIYDAESRPRQKLIVTIGIIANLGILGFFKYYDFFLEELGGMLAGWGYARDLPLLQIILPVGVSFFTFQGMSYLIDVYRGRIRAESLLDITLLMSFFPHLVAGPIVRGADLLKSTARQLLLIRALGYSTPTYFHCELMLDQSGARLAKRHDALSIRHLRESGMLAKQVIEMARQS